MFSLLVMMVSQRKQWFSMQPNLKEHSKSRIYLDTVLPSDVSNGSVVKVGSIIENGNKGSLIYPTGGSQVSSISQGTDDSKITFFYRKDFITESSGSGGNITFTAQLPFGTQRFAKFTPENFVMTVLDAGSATNVAKGDVIYLTEDDIVTDNTTDVTSGLNAVVYRFLYQQSSLVHLQLHSPNSN